jgi:hypothetical protein
MGVLLGAALASLLAADTGCALPAPDSIPWPRAETLTYEVGASRLPGSASATLRLADGDGQVALSGEARGDLAFGLASAGGAARSWLDGVTLRPLRYDDRTWLGPDRATSTAELGRGAAVRIRWTSGDRRGVNAFVRQPDVLDALSAIYRLRATPVAAGDRLCFDLVGGKFAWRVSATVHEAERVATPAGAFVARRIDGRAVRTDRSGETARLQLWVSDDPRRLPVQATIETRGGRLRARLAAVDAGEGAAMIDRRDPPPRGHAPLGARRVKLVDETD